MTAAVIRVDIVALRLSTAAVVAPWNRTDVYTSIDNPYRFGLEAVR